MLGASGGLLIAWLRSRRDWMRVLCAMMIAASLAGLSADFLRGVTGRTRPYTHAPQGWYGVRRDSQWLVFQHAYNSFPSGHTTTAVAFALPLFFWRRRLGLAAFLFIAAVAWARVYVGAHHISDVVAGAALGGLIAAWIWRRSAEGERIVNAFPWWRERV